MKKRTLTIIAAALALCSCGNAGKSLSSAPDPGEEYVNTGYGHVKKKNSTSAISSLKIEQGSGYSNIYDYIKGRVAGVEVVGTSIRIRGERSILGSNEPLILVDGLEMSDIGSISPDMVKSIDVLKDASSTAMYGSRGANGVILITTRK